MGSDERLGAVQKRVKKGSQRCVQMGDQEGPRKWLRTGTRYDGFRWETRRGPEKG